MSPITKRIVSIVQNLGIQASITEMLMLFFIFNVLRSMIFISSRYFLVKTKYTVQFRLMTETFKDFFQTQWHFFSSNKEGVLLNTFMREITILGDAFMSIANAIACSIQGLLYIVVPFFISWKVSLVGLSSALIFMLPFTLFGKLSYKLGQMNTNTANDIGSIIQESLSSAKVILGFSNQNKNLILLNKALNDHQKATLKSQTLSTAIHQLYQPFGILVLIITLVSGKWFKISLSEIVVILYSFLKIIPLIGEIASSKNNLSNFLPSYEQVMNLRKYAGKFRQKSGSINFEGLKREILIDKLSFAYSGHRPVLIDINITIPKGKMVAFVGKSGVGKSTLIDLLMGFYEPSSGKIIIDDIPLQKLDIFSYRKKMGYVPQTSMLFNMTIRENLLWSNDTASDDEIDEACRLANVIEFIEKMPDGYNTVVGDKGIRLSGGQVQRIALARAILRQPDLLILDEATSSLDTESERMIQSAIENISKKTTVIVIAHRLSTIVNADYVYVLNDAHVEEEGTYVQLCQKKGLFERMLKMQLLK